MHLISSSTWALAVLFMVLAVGLVVFDAATGGPSVWSGLGWMAYGLVGPFVFGLIAGRGRMLADGSMLEIIGLGPWILVPFGAGVASLSLLAALAAYFVSLGIGAKLLPRRCIRWPQTDSASQSPCDEGWT